MCGPRWFGRSSPEGDGAVDDVEVVLGCDGKRGVAHAIAIRIFLPNRYRLAVRTEKRFAHFHVHAHSILSLDHFAVLVERVQEGADAPHGRVTDTLEFGAKSFARALELVGGLREVARCEHETHHVVRTVAAGILAINTRLVERVHKLVPFRFELAQEVRDGALRGGHDEHGAG